jgi:uroporphyrinogen-III synthase
MKIVTTRERGHNDALRGWLPEEAHVDEVPLTTTIYLDEEVVANAVRVTPAFGSFRALVVTSARSARFATSALAALSHNAEIFSVGPSTTKALIEREITVRAQATGASIDLVRQIIRGPVLVIGAATMRDELSDALRERDFDVTSITCYETATTPPDDAGAQLLRDADVVFVGAPSTWTVAQSFVRSDAWVVVPGPTTGVIVREQHERVIEGWGPSLRERLNVLDADS